MSCASVSVLAPNGRRQTVKCTANTTIMQILEEVCRKQGFKPEEYDIKHHNKVLDTSISFRFSGLPNNAQLEMAVATKARVDSEVILAINFEDGSRIMGNFQPDDILFNIMLKLCPKELESSENLVLIYMRNEIFGENLQKTTLRSLGLRGGRAMMRLVHKNPQDLKMQANVSTPLPVKPVEEKPFHRTLKTEEVLSDNKKIQKKDEIDLIKLVKEREKRKLESPSKVETPTSRPKVEELKEETMEVDIIEECPQNKYVQKTDEAPTKEVLLQEENFVFLGERQAMLFSLESSKSLPAEDLPDDFFELTIDDAKKILHDIKRKRHEMEHPTLMTSAMRNLEESKKQLRQLHKYKQSVIRVQFPDRTILQGSFKPTESIKDVQNFVISYLQDSNVDFYLYTTPPKSILSKDKTLLESGCVPGALLHLGTTNKNETIFLKTELRDKFTTNSVASLAASKLREKSTREEPVQEQKMDEDDSVEDMNVAGPSSQPTTYERKVYTSPEKVPKWFKPFK